MSTAIPGSKVLKVVASAALAASVPVYWEKSGSQLVLAGIIAPNTTKYFGPYVEDAILRFGPSPTPGAIATSFVGDGSQIPAVFSDGPNGQVTMNGATNVVVTDSFYQPGRLVLFAYVSGTSTGSAPNIKAGVAGQFTVASVVGDTAVYNYNIL